MKPPFLKKEAGPYIILLAAALLFGLSYAVNQYHGRRASLQNESATLQRYILQQEKEIDDLSNDTALLKRFLHRQETEAELKDLTRKSFSVYLYAPDAYGNQFMQFWSSQHVVPDEELRWQPDGALFTDLANGSYVVIKRSFSAPAPDTSVIMMALIPVRYHYYVDNDNLRNRFAYSSSNEQHLEIDPSGAGVPIKSREGKTLFSVKEKEGAALVTNDRFTIILRFAALLLLFLFLHVQAEAMARKQKPWYGVLFLAVALIGIRTLIYYFPALLNLRQFDLFDPAIYGSSAVQKSLGDFLLNALLFCWLVLFTWSKFGNRIRIHHLSLREKWVAGIFSLLLIVSATFFLASAIKSLVADSQISFDVTDFFSLNWYSVAGFLVLAALAIAYFYLTRLLFQFVFAAFKRIRWLVYLVSVVAGLLFLTVRQGRIDTGFFLLVLCWLELYTLLFMQERSVFNRLRINIAGLLFWIFIFSVSIAAIILTENRAKEWLNRKHMAEKLILSADPMTGVTPATAMIYLDNDFLQGNFNRFRDAGENRRLRDSIINHFPKEYLNNFRPELYAFDENGNALNNQDPTTYSKLNTIINVEAKPTNSPDMFRYDIAVDKLSFITRREVKGEEGQFLGSFFVVSYLKKYRSEGLSTELFRQIRSTSDPETNPVYTFAIYDSLRLQKSSAGYPFPTSLLAEMIPKAEFHKEVRNGMDELWYRAGKEKIAVVVRKRDSVIETISLFSYIFCSFLFLATLLQLASWAVRLLLGQINWKALLQFNIRTQVHSTIIFISLLSFIIIGIATISFFNQRYKRNNREKLSRTMKIMVSEMEKKLANHETFDDVLRITDSATNQTEMDKLASEVAAIHNVDVNIYDLNGDLEVSSDPDVYQRGIFSKKMNPEAFYHLSRLNQLEHAQTETIGKLNYPTIYAPYRNTAKQVAGYLNIPFFNTQNDLNLEISNFLVTLINLNAFIFLIAGVIALFITNRITNSFSVIGDKMKEINLGKINEQINWNRDDEIGELVKEYNKMVVKLGDSATALAKSEREGAWREMARQVAHEIKNPLTPMKLSIQYLQKAIDQNQPNVKELTANVARTLVEQIDHLSKIAADFSQFANIGNTHVEQFDLHEILKSLKDLYEPYHRVDFSWNPLPHPVWMKADKTQMNRLFTNLFQNAVEASEGKSFAAIDVQEVQQNGHIRISVKDNGEGIAPEMQGKIFVPNFTTKSSGTGLGLAMCKGIVEQAQGKIWFETRQGEGTTFHIELPVMNNDAVS